MFFRLHTCSPPTLPVVRFLGGLTESSPAGCKSLIQTDGASMRRPYVGVVADSHASGTGSEKGESAVGPV